MRTAMRPSVKVFASADRNGMQSYRLLRKKMIETSCQFACVGSCIAFAVKGVSGMEAFVYGSTIGLANQWLMQSEVENIGSLRNVLQLLNNQLTRLALSVAILYITYTILDEHVEKWQVGGAFTGFLMSRLGMVHEYLHAEIGPEQIQDDDRGAD